MGWVWNDSSADVKTVFLEGVIPLVLGISLCFVGGLYCLGIINFSCCKRHDDQVAPVVIMTEAGRENDGNDPTTTRERADGPVACEAQLCGMTPKERQAVLENIFSSCSTHKESLKKASSSGGGGGGAAAAAAADDEGKAADSDEEDSMEKGDFELDTACSCAICLREYEPNDLVLTGCNCNHLFHKQCAMAWMTNRRPKDHCPFCRKEMMNAEEMKKAAVDVLGNDRVTELAADVPGNDGSNSSADNNDHVVVEVPRDDGSTSNAESIDPVVELLDIEV